MHSFFNYCKQNSTDWLKSVENSTLQMHAVNILYVIFPQISYKSYFVTIRWNRLEETIQTNGNNIGLGWETRKLAFENTQNNRNICRTGKTFIYIVIGSKCYCSSLHSSNTTLSEAAVQFTLWVEMIVANSIIETIVNILTLNLPITTKVLFPKA